MRKIKLKNLPRTIAFVLCFAIIIGGITAIFLYRKNEAEAEDEMIVLDIWEIDNFEGGKGSRASYLQNAGSRFGKKYNCYVTVQSLSADAARYNLENGARPDLISYGAGIYGIEKYLYGYTTWAHGGYCFLTIDETADFSDISAENTIINTGIDNLYGAAALLCGVGGADSDKPTGAYVKLIGGKYKYLLGTQRDMYRLTTRGTPYKVKAVTEFNDLYQNISVSSEDTNKKSLAEMYINFLLRESENLTKVGLMSDKIHLYSQNFSYLEGIDYNLRLTSPVSKAFHDEIMTAIRNADINYLKNLLNN